MLCCSHPVTDVWMLAMQAGGYYLGMLAYFWVLATPAVGFPLRCGSYISPLHACHACNPALCSTDVYGYHPALDVM